MWKGRSVLFIPQRQMLLRPMVGGRARSRAIYSAAYAIADSPLGPFGRIRKSSPDGMLRQEQGSIRHQRPARPFYYIVYHRRPAHGEHGRNHRVGDVLTGWSSMNKEGHGREITQKALNIAG